MKSAWAYKNGKRMMTEAISSQKNSVPSEGFVESNRIKGMVYARRRYNEFTREYYLSPVGYANKTQADKMIEKLKANGIECVASFDHPYVLTLINN